MILVMKTGTPEREIQQISQELQRWKIKPEKTVGNHKVIIALIGDTADINPQYIQQLSPFIEEVLRVKQPFKRVSREFRYGEPTEVLVPTLNGAVSFSENHSIVTIAGPCSVENEEMIVQTARQVKAASCRSITYAVLGFKR